MMKVQLYYYHFGYGLVMGDPIEVQAENISDAMRHFTRLPTCTTGRAETLAARVWPSANPRVLSYVYFRE